MRALIITFIPVLEIFLVFVCILGSICGRRLEEQNYYPGNVFYQQERLGKVSSALSKLEHEPEWSSQWLDPSIQLGQVSGVAVDSRGLVLVFHRASNQWEQNTFNSRNVYQAIGEPAIPHPTILVFNDTGSLVDMWGQNLFYMPHGITVDNAGNVWVTDVAMHQVLKFTPQERQKPALILGEKFVPGNDEEHFCKPSAVAVSKSGDFFVADGYCNTRIIKFAPDGTRILQWGRRSGESPFVFNIPHALTLAEDRGLVCVADREHGRVPCFDADNGTFALSFSNWLVGSRIYSVAYSPLHGGRLYLVNGPGGGVPVRGYVIDFDSGRIIQTFAPGEHFTNPHDIAVSPDGSRVYVTELDPRIVSKFVDQSATNLGLNANSTSEPTPVKPTAIVESSVATVGGDAWWVEWRGAAGGAAGALAAALVAVAGLALLRARTRGRKGAPRRRWEYGHGEFKLRRLLERRRFTRVHSEDSDDEPAPMLPPALPAQPATA